MWIERSCLGCPVQNKACRRRDLGYFCCCETESLFCFSRLLTSGLAWQGRHFRMVLNEFREYFYIHTQLGFSSLRSTMEPLGGWLVAWRVTAFLRLFEEEGASFYSQKYEESHPILKELYRVHHVLQLGFNIRFPRSPFKLTFKVCWAWRPKNTAELGSSRFSLTWQRA